MDVNVEINTDRKVSTLTWDDTLEAEGVYVSTSPDEADTLIVSFGDDKSAIYVDKDGDSGVISEQDAIDEWAEDAYIRTSYNATLTIR